MTFKEFLNKKHLEYQISQERTISAKEFAQWLGASPTSKHLRAWLIISNPQEQQGNDPFFDRWLVAT